MVGGGEEIKNTCTKKGGEGIGGRGRPGGEACPLATFSFFLFFFKRRLSSFCFMTSKSPPQSCPSHLTSAAELIKHQKAGPISFA